MRVTTKGIYDNIIANLGVIAEDLKNANEVVATGKRINSLSDDPLGLNTVLNLRSARSNIEQLHRNISIARTWLNSVESALGSVIDLVVDANVLCIQMANDTIGADQRVVAATTIQTYLEKLKGLANADVNGRYIFAGSKTDAAPFEIDGTYNGDSNPFSVKIGKNMNIEAGRDGEAVFGAPEVPIVSTSEMTVNGGGGVTDKTYTFTVTTGGTVEDNDSIIHWENDNLPVDSGDVLIDSGAGVYNFGGILLEFTDGTLVEDNSFSLKTDGTGAPVEFIATVSDCRANEALATYTFTVGGAGGTIGTDAITLDWECKGTLDPFATVVKDGTIVIPASGGEVTVDGMTVDFVSGILEDGESFVITTDVHKVPTLQPPSDWHWTTTSGGEDDIFKTLLDLKTALETDDVAEIQVQMDRLDRHINHINAIISDTGQKEIRLDIRNKIIGDLDFAYTERISKLEDADIIHAVVELKAKEMAYQAALTATGKAMELSLVDYI